MKMNTNYMAEFGEVERLLTTPTRKNLDAANALGHSLMKRFPSEPMVYILTANAVVGLQKYRREVRLQELGNQYIAIARNLLGDDFTESWASNLYSQVQTPKPVKFIARSKVKGKIAQESKSIFYDTSTHAPFAHDHSTVVNASVLSPFVNYEDIPVPGAEGVVSDTVEGVWQGLKLIDGHVDYSFFKGKGRKRYGQVKGHQFGTNKVLNYVEARRLIYTPTYEHMLTCEPARKLVSLIETRARNGIEQFLFDVDDVEHVTDTSGAMAHSAVLARYINERLKRPTIQKE